MRALADSWPGDAFHSNLQLRVFLKALATHPKLTADAVKIMQALKDDKLYHTYRPTKRTLHPPSIPEHYVRLVEGVQKAQQGIGRPWWKRILGLW
ncbi:hypothetical protein AURDEDRAFT_69079 [Auricularia subglabra TFB-10046 SS5]|nr:hypothetical protein AURDEDRAFT_69079 [Auricularia subglabra TFB-10046 SS5]